MLRNKRGLTVVVSIDEEEDEGSSELSNGERATGVTADDGEEETRETLLDLLRWRRELELQTEMDRGCYGSVFPVFMHAPSVYFYAPRIHFFSGFSLVLSASV